MCDCSEGEQRDLSGRVVEFDYGDHTIMEMTNLENAPEAPQSNTEAHNFRISRDRVTGSVGRLPGCNTPRRAIVISMVERLPSEHRKAKIRGSGSYRRATAIGKTTRARGLLAPHGNSPREAATEMRYTENLIPVLHWIGWRKQKIQVAEMF